MKKLWIVGALLLLGVISAGGYHWWHSAASTTATVQPKPVSSLVLGSETSLTPWQTGLFTTQRPSDWRILQTTENPTGPAYGSYVLTGTGDHQADQLAITISNLGNNTMQEISAVKIRASQTSQYSSARFGYAPPSAIGFVARSQYEASLFWQHGSQYVAAVVSGPPQHQAELNQALEAVVSHIAWQ